MNYIAAQLTLASRSDDAESWMNILFVVILAVFWAVAGIVKARANKPQTGEGEEESPGQQARGRPTRASRLREQLLKQFYGLAEPPEREPSGPRPERPGTQAPAPTRAEPAYAQAIRRAAQKQPAQPKRTERLPGAQSLSELQSARPGIQARTEIETLPVFEHSLVADLADGGVRAPAQPPRAGELAEILLDYSDPEELRRAILHYEILGRPLSLRDPSAGTP